MVAWSLKCNVKSYIFMNLKIFKYECGIHISHVQNILLISSECPFHTLGVYAPTFQVYIIFIGLQRS